MKEKIISETPMCISFVKDGLEKIRQGAELNFRAQKTLEHAETARLTAKQAKELIENLMKLEIPRFKEVMAHKLADTCPLTPDEVKTVLSPYNLTIAKEQLQKIADTIIAVKPKQ